MRIPFYLLVMEIRIFHSSFFILHSSFFLLPSSFFIFHFSFFIINRKLHFLNTGNTSIFLDRHFAA